MRNMLWGFIFGLSLFPGATFGFANKTTSGDCSPVITGDIKAPVTIECGKDSGIPPGALAKLEAYLQESHRSQKNLNDFIDKLRNEVADWEQKYKSALVQNAADREKHPDNPLLAQEQQALQAGELEQAAQIRERYYQKLKREKTVELAQEAYTAAERWENAFNLPKALSLYQEAVLFRRDYPEAWRNTSLIARKLGNNTLALEAAQNLQKQFDPDKDPWWFAVALMNEADILLVLGDNRKAFKKYQQSQLLLAQLVKAEPDNLNLQRDLSVSHNKVGDMHLKSGDNAAALKAYQDGLAIAKKLAELDPDVVEWQTDLVVSYFKLSQILIERQDALLTDALDILYRLRRERRLDHEKLDWIGSLEGLLQPVASGYDETPVEPEKP